MIATAALGGIWSCCSPDFAVSSVIDRFQGIAPKVMIMSEGYHYSGKYYDQRSTCAALALGLSSLCVIVVVGQCARGTNKTRNATEMTLDGFSATIPVVIYNNIPEAVQDIEFEKFPFNIPMVILYSSGTTGMPKPIVHGAGGTLIQHMKEHQLQCDIKPGDIVFYYTTCGWMMWNWLVSVLASGATIVLYDGSPLFPATESLIDIADRLGVTFFGTSAKYLSVLQKSHYTAHRELAALKTIASTGSPLLPETYDYVYEHIKQDIHLMSISGGTDIISCFFIGNPWDPVRRGELQGAGLGYAIDIFEDDDHDVQSKSQSVARGVQGELVCTQAFPSQPLFFWTDYDPVSCRILHQNVTYNSAYFNHYKGLWHHGDRVEKTVDGGYIIHGRSDAILNPGGVRIGTSEIYRQVSRVPEVVEAMAVGQVWRDDIRIVLFVVLKPGMVLDNILEERIKQQIRQHTTPRHVPQKILQIDQLPHTRNGKLAEVAAKNCVNGIENKNIAVIVNPESLDLIQKLLPMLKD